MWCRTARQHPGRTLPPHRHRAVRHRELTRLSGKSKMAEIIRYVLSRRAALERFLTDGRIEIDSNIVERAIRPQTKGVSLCTPLLSDCKHWKRIHVDGATRATFRGYGSFDRLRRQVFGTDLIRRTGHHLNSRKDAGLDKAAYRMVCDA